EECNTILGELKTRQSELDELAREYNTIRTRARDIKNQMSNLKQMTLTAVDKARRIKAAIDKASQEFIDNSDKIE
ncbi:AAA family ATPase, partial [Escherichia coli]